MFNREIGLKLFKPLAFLLLGIGITLVSFSLSVNIPLEILALYMCVKDVFIYGNAIFKKKKKHGLYLSLKIFYSLNDLCI